MSNPEYPRVDVEALPDAPNPTTHKKEVDEALGIEAFGFNVYTARPGERLPWGYHYRLDHEELLYVIEGELELETPETRGTGGDDDGGTADGGGEDEGEPPRLAAGEALLVSPGAPQCTRAVGDSVTRVIAAGAPKDADGAVISEFCPPVRNTPTGRTTKAKPTTGPSTCSHVPTAARRPIGSAPVPSS
jgi:quercetin dioxygenase-like cupin family protein